MWEAEFPRGPPGFLRVGLLHLYLHPRTPSDARWACVSCGGRHLTSTQHCLQLWCLWTSVLNLSKNPAWFPHLGKTLWSEAPANVSQVRKTIPCSSDGRDVGAFSRSGDWGRSTHTNSLIHSLDQWLVLTLYLSELSYIPKLAPQSGGSLARKLSFEPFMSLPQTICPYFHGSPSFLMILFWSVGILDWCVSPTQGCQCVCQIQWGCCAVFLISQWNLHVFTEGVSLLTKTESLFKPTALFPCIWQTHPFQATSHYKNVLFKSKYFFLLV